MNVVSAPGGDGFVLRLDLSAIHEMLHDYYAQDLWRLALDPALPGRVEMVIADRSPTLDASDRARLEVADLPHLHVHHIDAGHWLHIESPANVVELLGRELPTSLP
jgi:pimeloyl-ACP methyl ester carboxylesterase